MAMSTMQAPAVRHAVRDVAALLAATIGTAGVIAALSVVVGSWS